VIDLHAHLLPGVDDGPEDLEGSLAMALVALEAGIDAMAATPHIEHQIGVDPAVVPELVDDLRFELARADIPLRILPGGELSLARCPELTVDELAAIAIGGRWVLLECPLRVGISGGLERAAFELQSRGLDVLLAHPERCPDLIRDHSRLVDLVARGARCQVTAGALDGQYGAAPRALATALLEEGLVHAIASDGHGAVHRVPDMRPGLAAASSRLTGFSGEVEDWLTEDAPAAIAIGADVPERAPAPVRRRLRARLGR
jgi:protein-tyrosine phosphatase